MSSEIHYYNRWLLLLFVVAAIFWLVRGITEVLSDSLGFGIFDIGLGILYFSIVLFIWLKFGPFHKKKTGEDK